MDLNELGEGSNEFFSEMTELLNRPLGITSQRLQISMVECAMSMEHWLAVRSMLEYELYSPAVFGHRAQRNTLIRAHWHCFKADNNELMQLDPSCSLEDDSQLAVMAPMDTMKSWVILSGWKDGNDRVSNMLHHSSVWFREYLQVRWQPMPNPTTHYPQQAMKALQRDSNGLLFMAVLLTLMMSKNQEYLQELRLIALDHVNYLPEAFSRQFYPDIVDI